MRSLLCVVAAALAAAALPAHAQVRAGGQFLVNTTTTGLQSYSAVASDRRGNFIVVWGQGFTQLIQGQRYDRAGARIGGEFTIDSLPAPSQFPAVAMNRQGGFLVAWIQDRGATSLDIHARAYDPAGVPVGPEFRLNEFLDDIQAAPNITADGKGDFVVTWWSYGQDGSMYATVGRRVSAKGQPLGLEFVVNTFTYRQQFLGDVAADADGNFVVAWTNQPAYPTPGNVYAQRFDAAGAPLGANFLVNTSTPGMEIPAVAMAADGRFVIAYESDRTGQGDIFARRYTADGAAAGAEFRVNVSTNGLQHFHDVDMDAQGGFVVSWLDELGDGSSAGVRARRFAADGTARGAEFLVNSYTTGGQRSNGVGMVDSDEVGNFVITWWNNLDLNDPDVYAQRYGGLHPSALAVDPAGNGVWEPGETVDVRPAWFNASGAALTVGGGLAGLTGPAGATYTISDGTAAYPPLPDNTGAACGDCYRVGVSAPAARPQPHWDARAVETLTPDAQGQTKGWALHIGSSFGDVPATSLFYRFVETLLHTGVTAGCGDTLYCPGQATTREQMAAFVLVAREGSGFRPAACTTPVFGDVPATSPFCPFIEELARRGVVNGCGGPNYCPSEAVTREQMAVFTLRTLDPALLPPSCGTPVFDDVPPASPFCRWIEELARRGVVAGCGGRNYCPADAVTREQMAVFLGATFGLTLYGP